MENSVGRLLEDAGFRDDVLRGLSRHRRSVPSRWLYDDHGSELFEDITFQPDAFRHDARWNPDEFAVEMHIVSLRPQVVRIAGFDFDFSIGDAIHTESSRKYDAQSFTRLAELGGWDVAEIWTDAERQFAVFGLIAAEPAQGS